MHEVITQDINAARGYGLTPLPAGRDASRPVTWAPRCQSSKASSPSPQPTSSACKPATLLASSRNHRPLQTIGDDADIGGAPFGVEARSQARYGTICLKSSIPCCAINTYAADTLRGLIQIKAAVGPTSTQFIDDQ
jgi:hypothetical protein